MKLELARGKNAHFGALLYGGSTLGTTGGEMARESCGSNTGFVETIIRRVGWYKDLYQFHKQFPSYTQVKSSKSSKCPYGKFRPSIFQAKVKEVEV